LYENVVS